MNADDRDLDEFGLLHERSGEATEMVPVSARPPLRPIRDAIAQTLRNLRSGTPGAAADRSLDRPGPTEPFGGGEATGGASSDEETLRVVRAFVDVVGRDDTKGEARQILEPAQLNMLSHIYSGYKPPSKLGALAPGRALALQPAQIVALQAIFSDEASLLFARLYRLILEYQT